MISRKKDLKIESYFWNITGLTYYVPLERRVPQIDLGGVSMLDCFHFGEGSGGDVYCHLQQPRPRVFDGFFSLDYGSGVEVYAARRHGQSFVVSGGPHQGTDYSCGGIE